MFKFFAVKVISSWGDDFILAVNGVYNGLTSKEAPTLFKTEAAAKAVIAQYECGAKLKGKTPRPTEIITVSF